MRINNFPSRHLRVGDYAGIVLEELAAGEELEGGGFRRLQGSRVTVEAAKAWWAKAEKVGEEAYMVERLLPPVAKDGRTLWLRSLPLRLIVTKYPKRLPELYREVLDKRPDLQSWELAEEIAKSAMPAKEKADLFAAVGEHEKLDHRLPALRALKELDEKRFNALLLTTVEKLPKDVTELYCGCQEAAVARLAVECGDPKVWAAFEAAVERASLGLRMEMLHNLAGREVQGRRAARLRLLVAHLDDTEVMDRKEDKRFDGPGAGFPYHRITVGDAVALDLGRMVGVEVPYKPDRTAAEWAAVREQVRKAVKADLQKTK
jgi:hypothetical protein